jgi:Family of unknown function (DUF6519)
MSSDFSRLPFDPRLDYAGVLLQQGRPLTDWDWNAQLAQANRRQQATTMDILGPDLGGRAIVPETTPHGFELSITGGMLTVARGRVYVDGLLVENHGLVDANTGPAWDPTLAEEYGTAPLRYIGSDATLNDQQPWLRQPPPLPTTGGPYLVYLDVWQREVTQFTDPALVDVALGVDTTSRLQTVWQLKILPQELGTQTCDTPLSDLPGWDPLNAPSAGLLSTSVVAFTSSDPCLIPPGGGYKGQENQLYRVEIHTPGAPGTATFCWSRDNASVEARVLEIVDARTLALDSLGKDAVLGFSVGDWIELSDEWRELANLPGDLFQIADNGIDDATRRVTVTADMTPAWPIAKPDVLRRTRIRRWDQQGPVLKSDGTTWVADLVAAGGAITVPPAGTTLVLENGVSVAFDVAEAGGAFHVGDWWVFAARAADASLEILDHAPPRGIHHHYGKLGTISGGAIPAVLGDCRLPWPPMVQAASGTDCACTVCVAQGDNLQTAIDSLPAQGGQLCLAAGTWLLAAPVLVRSRKRIVISGAGPATRIDAGKNPAALVFLACQEIELRQLAILGGGLKDDTSAYKGALTFIDCDETRIIDCDLSGGELATGTSCINAATTIAKAANRLTIAGNRLGMVGQQTGVVVQSSALVRISGNRIGLATATKAAATTPYALAGITLGGTLQLVQVHDNTLSDVIDGMLIGALTAQGGPPVNTLAGPPAATTEVVISRNNIHTVVPDKYQGAPSAITVAGARSLHIVDTVALLASIATKVTGAPPTSVGILVHGEQGPFLAIRQSSLTGYLTGIAVRPATAPPKIHMWIAAETMAAEATTTVEDAANALIKQNNLP